MAAHSFQMPETLTEFDTKCGENMSSHNNKYVWACQHSVRSHCCLKAELRIQALPDQIEITILIWSGKELLFFFFLRDTLRFIMSCTGCKSIVRPHSKYLQRYRLFHMWVKHFGHCRLNTEVSVSKINVNGAIQSYLYNFCVINNFLKKTCPWRN